MKKAQGPNCCCYLFINNTGDALYTIFGENLVNNINHWVQIYLV